MKDLIIDSLNCTDLNPSMRETSFELFGYDFLIDEDYWIWLIEINTNPYLGVPNAFILDLLPKMVSEMLQIVIDPHFPPEKPQPQYSNYEVIFKTGYS